MENLRFPQLLSKELIAHHATKPYIISGPCSAETEEQVHQTLDALCAEVPQIAMFRAGIWKPRTRPGAFEGVGETALSWLKAAAQKHQKPCCVEVASAAHVEAALKANIDVLWIGARTTVNPFMVQDIADALQGCDIPVYIKNPVNPDLDLWMGAIERFYKVGLKKIGAIHRGFSSYAPSEYRNKPTWEIPIELKRRIPNIIMLCDPSHICGNRHMLEMVSQKAIDLRFDGVMIESHINPDAAWSDAKQQITPQALKQLLTNLVIRSQEPLTDDRLQALQDMRSKIDRIDNYIIELLAERMQVSEEIGAYKAQNNITIFQPERWAQIVERIVAIGKASGLSETFLMHLIQQINKESIRHQTKVMNKE